MVRTVRVYRSTDTGAPVLTGEAGKLIALLDACLVTGYDVKPAAGWTKPYTGVNVAAFRNSPTEGTGSYLRVKDDYTSSAARTTALAGYVAMTGIDTGTDLFASTNTYLGIAKSATADTTARPWVLIADETCFYLFMQNGENGTDYVPVFFGDIFSYVANDPYRALISASYSTNYAYTNARLAYCSVSWGADSGTFMPRNHAGAGSYLNVGRHTDVYKLISSSSTSSFYMGATGVLSYPNIVNSGLFMAPVWVHQTGTTPYVVRGYMPGMWAPLHNRPLANNDTFSGVGAMAGKTFEAFNVYSLAQIFIETSNTWG